LNIKNRQQEFDKLREEFPFFEYRACPYHFDDAGFHASFHFNISDKYQFTPSIDIPNREIYHWGKIGKQDLDNLVFHLGMIELISYWKLTCSPEIRILPYKLSAEQVLWWKKLYWHGLGEFLYLNGVEISFKDLMELNSFGEAIKIVQTEVNNDKVMVPIGGGKDSVVTLELLKSGQKEVFPMAVNIRPAISRTIQNAGFELSKTLEVKRNLDPLMLELNQQGFLNGHTPFSAMLAFLTVLLAAGSGIGNIALSNESSASQSTVPGTIINHQYSKSFEFEKDFDEYVRRFIHPDIRYFSFLRPINELQIAGLFSQFNQHHDSFRSCNVGSKLDQWCGACPKCLFTYLILSPFMRLEQLKLIFGGELLEKQQLSIAFDELTGHAHVKPFECVGTPDEVNAAVGYAFRRSARLPILLKDYNFGSYNQLQFELLLKDFSEEHNLPSAFATILKKTIHDRLT
jgi:hypothetical protein